MTCSVGLLSTEWASLNLQQDINQLHRIPVAHGFLWALGRGWNGRGGVPIQVPATGFKSKSPEQCPGRLRHRISWQETPGQHSWHLFCPKASVSYTVLPSYTPHPSCMQMKQNYGKTTVIGYPSVLPRTDVCVSWFRHSLVVVVIAC